MRVVEVERLREDLTEYTADVFASLTRSGWQERAGWYLHGLMLDGRRKSIQPMAAWLGGAVHEQALNHFVTNSPWQVEPVRSRIAELIDEAVTPLAWAVGHGGQGSGSDVTVMIAPLTGDRLPPHGVVRQLAIAAPSATDVKAGEGTPRRHPRRGLHRKLY